MSNTFGVTAVTGAYEIDGSNNPTLQVNRGETYTFNLNVTGHPFYLQTTGGGYDSASLYTGGGWLGNGQVTGSYDWTVPSDAPDSLFYQCGIHSSMGGQIDVSGAVEKTYPEVILRNELVNDSALSAIISTRVYPVIAPVSADLPWIVFKRTGVRREQTLGNPMGTPIVSLEIASFAMTYEDAREIADLVRLVLDGYGGTSDNTEIKQVSLENELDDFVQLGSDSLPVFQVTQNFDVIWQEI